MTDAEACAREFQDLFPKVFLLLHRRTGKGTERLGAQGWAVLQHLSMSGPLTVGEMALHMERAQSVISEMVDSLETRGLLARMRDERDRRRTLVWLTDAAHQLLAEEREVLDRTKLAAAFASMDEADRKALFQGFHSLIRSAEALGIAKNKEKGK